MKINTYLKHIIASTVLTFAFGCGCGSGKIDTPPSKQSGYFVTITNNMSNKEMEKYLDNMEVQGWRLISYNFTSNKCIFHKP